MPLLEVSQTKQISASIRPSYTTATQVDQYAAFIRACADEVVEQALYYVFSKDPDFQEFLKTPEARQVASTLRIRKVPVPEAVESPGKRLGFHCSIRIYSYTSSRRIKGMILIPNPCRDHYGASHRTNFDTSSPSGCCGPPLRHSLLTSFPAIDYCFMFTDVNTQLDCRIPRYLRYQGGRYRNYVNWKRIQANAREVSIGGIAHGLLRYQTATTQTSDIGESGF